MNRSATEPSARFALVNGLVILPDTIVADRAVVINGDKIAEIAELNELDPLIERVDVGGRYVSPGLIDIHIHGALGHTFLEPDADAYAAITAENLRRGVTSLLATLATAPIPELVASLEFCRRWMASPRTGAQVLGVHLEGPYFSHEQRGAQNPTALRLPNDGTADTLLEQRDVLKIMTFAPELPGALELAARLDRLGIVPAVGHSAASDEQFFAAVKAGVRHVIHIWSGQSTMRREGPWRKPGLLEGTLISDGLTVEMICDNRHLPPTLMKLAYRCLGAERLCVISDASTGAGLAEGTRFQKDGIEYDVNDGVAMLLDRTQFAGSTTLVNRMIPILTQAVEVPLVNAIRMASLTPARAIGLGERKGSLAPGKDADIAIFEKDFSVWRTIVGGTWVGTSA